MKGAMIGVVTKSIPVSVSQWDKVWKSAQDSLAVAWKAQISR